MIVRRYDHSRDRPARNYGDIARIGGKGYFPSISFTVSMGSGMSDFEISIRPEDFIEIAKAMVAFHAGSAEQAWEAAMRSRDEQITT